jgi:hypothetical protein
MFYFGSNSPANNKTEMLVHISLSRRYGHRCWVQVNEPLFQGVFLASKWSFSAFFSRVLKVYS